MQVFLYSAFALILVWLIYQGIQKSRKQKYLNLLEGIQTMQASGLIQKSIRCTWSISWQDEGMKHGKHLYNGQLLFSENGIIFQADIKNHPALIITKNESDLKSYFKSAYRMMLQEIKLNGSDIEIVYKDPVEPYNVYTLQLSENDSHGLFKLLEVYSPGKKTSAH